MPERSKGKRAKQKQMSDLLGKVTITDLLRSWRKTNFPTATATDQLLGVGEEVGELMHHHLKDSQNIRGTHEEHVEGMRDAVGDILIYLDGYCQLQGWESIIEIYREVGAKIIKRDWINDPVAGGEGNTTVATAVYKEHSKPTEYRETLLKDESEVKEWDVGQGEVPSLDDL